MEGMEYFYELYEALPRCGPGNNESTRQAYSFIPDIPDHPLVLDIGCGPGVQTLELARLSGGRIIALDNHKPFLDELMKRARTEGLAHQITTMNISMHDMDFEDKRFDIIWSEGALYFMGFQNGLRRCHQLLKNNGCLAVTELVLLDPDPPLPLMEYLKNEYPAIMDIRGNMELIGNEEYNVISHFTLDKPAWLESYYIPMERELARLSKKYEDNEIASAAFEGMRKEIDMYKRYGDFYGYEFFVMQKIGF